MITESAIENTLELVRIFYKLLNDGQREKFENEIFKIINPANRTEVAND